MGDITIPIKTYPYTRKYETKNITKFKYIHYGDIHTGKAKKINEPSKLPSITKGNYSTLRNGDVVVADASEDYKGIADAAILLSTGAFSIIAGLHTIAFRPNRKLVFPMFIYYNLQTSRFKHYGYHVGTGLKVFGISSNLFFDYSAFHPSLIEQQEISKLIESLENLLSLQQRKLEQLKQLKKALLQQLFVGKNNKQPNLRFKNFDGEWEQCMLKEIKDVRDGTHNSPKYQKEGYPLVTSKNLITNGIDLSNVSFISKYDYQEINKRSKVETGDILFGMIGTIGNPVMVKKGGFAIKNVALIKNGGEVSNGFLLHLLKSAIFSQYIKKENAGGTQKFLGLSVIRSFKFKVPDKVEQGNIASIFDTLNRFITLQQDNLTQLTTLKKYLLQKLFI